MSRIQDTTLVTGASSGVGCEFARELARRSINLVLTARRKNRLEALASELRTDYNVEVHTIVLDLSLPDGPERLFVETNRLGVDITILINNAGFGKYGLTLDQDQESIEAMIRVNVVAPATLARLFARPMKKRGRGFILNHASFSALMPAPRLATYSATKSFLLSFSQALQYELRKTGVKVSALCPGWMITEFFKTACQQPTMLMRAISLPPPYVARVGIDGMFKGKTVIVPGWFYKIQGTLARFIPRSFASALAARATKC